LPLSEDALMRIILDTAAASKKTNGEFLVKDLSMI
jgi:hypothetical protein